MLESHHAKWNTLTQTTEIDDDSRIFCKLFVAWIINLVWLLDCHYHYETLLTKEADSVVLYVASGDDLATTLDFPAACIATRFLWLQPTLRDIETILSFKSRIVSYGLDNRTNTSNPDL